MSENTSTNMVCDLRSLGFVSADNGHIFESPLSPSFIDNRPTSRPKLLIENIVFHLL